jgi:single-strand DNA-binding protein
MYARSLCRVTLVGHVGRDVDLRYLPSGTPTATFTVAVNRPIRDAEGNRAEATDWHRVIAWEALAEWCGQHVHTGARALVDGRLESRRYTDREGVERTAWEVRAHDVVLLDAPRESTLAGPDEAAGEPPPAPAPPTPPAPAHGAARPAERRGGPAGRPGPAAGA